MTDESAGRGGLTRRQYMLLAAAGGVGAMGMARGLDQDGENGTLYGGKMALAEAFNVAGDLWVGPDSSKSTVTASSGRMYFASDTQLTYYGDGGSWVSLGVGTSGNKAPASHFQSLTTEVVGIGDSFHTAAPDATESEVQSVIDAASLGDTVWLPRFDNDKLSITSPLVIDKSIALKSSIGAATSENAGNGITDFYGAMIEQQTAGEDVLDLQINAEKVDLDGLLLTWESSIRDTDTGHGINADTADDGDASAKVAGLNNSIWRNVYVDGHDGDHYGAVLTNIQECWFGGLGFWGGGGVKIEQNHDSVHYGNATFTQFFSKLQNTGTAHGIHYYSASGLLNLVEWNRPQVNTSLPDNSQQHIKEEEDGGTIDSLTYVGVNLEAANDNGGIDRPTGNAIWLPSRVDANITQNNAPHIIETGGTTNVRDDFITTDLLEAITQYKLDGDQVITKLSGNPAFTNSAATTTPFYTAEDGVHRWRLDGAEALAMTASLFRLNGQTITDPDATETADGMTADPETAAEDGFIPVDLGGTTYQIPIYQA